MVIGPGSVNLIGPLVSMRRRRASATNTGRLRDTGPTTLGTSAS